MIQNMRDDFINRIKASLQQIQMSRKTSRSLDFKLRSITYRVSSNATQNSQRLFTIERSDASKATPHFFLNAECRSHRRSSYRYQSNTGRRPKAVFFDLGEIKRQQQALGPKAQTARMFQTFMNRGTKDTLRGKPRIKFPLIESNPEMSFMPFDIEYEPLQREVERCAFCTKDTGLQLSNLKAQLASLAQRKSELDPFVEGFRLKCQVLHKSLAQNRLRHLQYMVDVRQKIVQIDQQMRNIEDKIGDSIRNTKDVQRAIFDTTFELQLEPHLVPQL